MTSKVDAFSHIRTEQLLFTTMRARTDQRHGQIAKIVPLRFENGSDTTVVRRRRYRIPRMVVDSQEILYLIYFALPKFQEMTFEDKLQTIAHELYHISPQFNGDIRRFPGRNYAHGASRAAYNRTVREFAHQYLAREPDPTAIRFLCLTMTDLVAEFGLPVAMRVPIPRLERLDSPRPAKTRPRAPEGDPR